MEHAGSVTPQLSYFLHGGVLPDTQLVVDEPVGGENLLFKWIPLQRAHLRVCGDGALQLARFCVPEPNTLVPRAAPTGQKILLPGAPGQRLHSCFVIGHHELWLLIVLAPES